MFVIQSYSSATHSVNDTASLYLSGIKLKLLDLIIHDTQALHVL